MKIVLWPALISIFLISFSIPVFSSSIPFPQAAYAAATNQNAQIFAAAAVNAKPAPPLPLAPPINDNFANSTVIIGDSIVAAGNNGGATLEPGEPCHYYVLTINSYGDNSIWWRWTPASTGMFGIDTRGSLFSTIVAIYTGSTLTTLTRQQSNPGYIYINATAGTTYYIAATGLTSSDEGPITINIYPDTHCPLFNSLSFTNTIFSGIPSANGSILTFPSELITKTLASTNRYGIFHELKIVNEFYPQSLTVTDRKHTKIINGVTPGSTGPKYRVMAYNGKYCYIFDQTSETLYAFRVSKKGLKEMGSQYVGNLTQLALDGSTVYAIQSTVNLLRFSDTYSQLTVMDKNLKKVRWRLPFEKGFIHSGLLKKQLLIRESWNTYSIDLSFTSSDETLFTRSAPYSSGGSLFFSIDRKGGLFYWYQYMAIVIGLGTQVSYIDKDGVAVLNNAYLDSRTDITSYIPYTADYVYGLIEGPGNIRIAAYQIGKKIKRFGEQTVPHYIGGKMHDSTLFALQQDSSGATPLYGFTAFDKKLKKSVWNESLAEGSVTILNRKTAYRASVVPSGGSTIYTFRIFTAKKTIVSHQFVQ